MDGPRKDSSQPGKHVESPSITFRRQSPKAAFIPSFRSKFNFNTCLQTKGREQSLKKSELHSDCLKCYVQVVDYVDLHPRAPALRPAPKMRHVGVVTSMATSARNRKNLGFAEPKIWVLMGFWLILAAVTTFRWPLGCLVWWTWAWQLMAL